ncbi:fumarylacetoacetate hydrolase family protein [Mycobacterium sp. 236(2023)]|uniref:fumarylacetoacetate hydrolase family protein n=1 Tax=Mycobacterium sp. 236(2023) TaxID=3038163 RepID=UPI002414D69D|nr:fumarylacetoacetate hydrolase family protein [Mycobacterium sp. 236(2023)]MDG4668126.1 fumarylacetoacetate hydrolase family protein [Mycobacterium sp. 236(2023)]
MRIANLDGRLVIVTDAGVIDVEDASSHRFEAEPQSIYARWDDFREWAASADLSDAQPVFDTALLRPPAPRPAQLFAVGLNYREHAAETGLQLPQHPMVFTKFVSCLTGAYSPIAIPEAGNTDWEIELVVVIGRRAHRVSAERGWEHVAGLSVGQDLSERITQIRDPAPQQMSLGKSLPGYGPVGPWLVTPDELPDPDNLQMSCAVDGVQMQKASTVDMIFPVAELISQLSEILPLLPGDVLFTGTPSGVGYGMKPPRYLRPGQTLVSRIDGIGEMRNPIVAEHNTMKTRSERDR